MWIAALLLALFWIILSGRFDLFHLAAGLLAVGGACLFAKRLWRLPPPLLPWERTVRWRRWPGYLLWLGTQVVLSALQVARVVLTPRMPLSPGIVRFARRLPHAAARTALANSITLTPGTVTLDVDGDEFVVHALTAGNARSLSPDTHGGEMADRVQALFNAERGEP